MSRYILRKADIFVFKDSPELIAHVADFSFAQERPAVVSLAVNGKVLRFKVVGIGSCADKVAVRLAIDVHASTSGLEILDALDAQSTVQLIT